MDTATQKIWDYITEQGIRLDDITQGTGLSGPLLQSSLCPGGGRDLQADEFLAICLYLGKDRLEFADSVSGQKKV